MSKKNHNREHNMEAECVEEVVQDENAEVEKHSIGEVYNCKFLNVREKPSITSEVVAIIPIGTEVMIMEDTSTDEWYNVCLEAGITGFAMRKYIENHTVEGLYGKYPELC